MLREDLLNSLYAKRSSPAEFNFAALRAPNICQLLTEYDIGKIYDITTSVKYSSKVRMKIEAIREILRPRGFDQFANGTNRMGFRYLEDKSIILKVAYKTSGLDNGFREMRNQIYMQPFCTKTFEVHPSGTVSLHERVLPITNKEEFLSVIDDVFGVLTCLLGKYVLEDVGTKYFMNWGIRSGFGPVILDYPDLFELDGKKLYCNRPIFPNTKFPVCNGLIDYDEGFNTLVCKCCGKEYRASELEKARDNREIILEGDVNMKVRMIKNGVVLAESESITDTIVAPEAQKEKRGNILMPKIVTRYTNPPQVQSKYKPAPKENLRLNEKPEYPTYVDTNKTSVKETVGPIVETGGYVNTTSSAGLVNLKQPVITAVQKSETNPVVVTDEETVGTVETAPVAEIAEKEPEIQTFTPKEIAEYIDELQIEYGFNDEDMMLLVNLVESRTKTTIFHLSKEQIRSLFNSVKEAIDAQKFAEEQIKIAQEKANSNTPIQEDEDKKLAPPKQENKSKYPEGGGLKSKFVPSSDDATNY